MFSSRFQKTMQRHIHCIGVGVTRGGLLRVELFFLSSSAFLIHRCISRAKFRLFTFLSVSFSVTFNHPVITFTKFITIPTTKLNTVKLQFQTSPTT